LVLVWDWVWKLAIPGCGERFAKDDDFMIAQMLAEGISSLLLFIAGIGSGAFFLALLIDHFILKRRIYKRTRDPRFSVTGRKKPK
jgi:hypothetical protein